MSASVEQTTAVSPLLWPIFGPAAGPRPREPRRRLAVVRGVAIAALLVSAAYLVWRALFTLDGTALALALPLLAFELHQALGLGLFSFSLWDLDAGPRWRAVSESRWRTAILVPTYNEPREVLLPTLAAARAVRFADEVWVLDDGGREVRCAAFSARRGALLCAPMNALGQTLGVIHLARPDGGFTPAEVRIAAQVAEQAALAIGNARLLRTMRSLAMTDTLTGCHNARHFDPHVERELETIARDGGQLGIIDVDIDHFKSVNDSHGHPAGDEALKVFARTLLGTVRTSDVVARYGGEEFAIAVHAASVEETMSLAEKLRAAVEQQVVDIGPNRFLRLTASFGVAHTARQGTDRLALMRAADAALYAAKQAGRNRVVLADIGATAMPSSEPARRRADRGRRA
jgi:diguanylate cyclase (GGDEF)-like protein